MSSKSSAAPSCSRPQRPQQRLTSSEQKILESLIIRGVCNNQLEDVLSLVQAGLPEEARSNMEMSMMRMMRLHHRTSAGTAAGTAGMSEAAAANPTTFESELEAMFGRRPRTTSTSTSTFRSSRRTGWCCHWGCRPCSAGASRCTWLRNSKMNISAMLR